MMARLLDLLRGRSAKHSAQDAKDRLQFILLHDRIDLTPDQLNSMKKEILEVISKYVSVEQERVDIALQQRQRDSLIVAEIPFSIASEPNLKETLKEASEASEAFEALDKDDTGPVIAPD